MIDGLKNGFLGARAFQAQHLVEDVADVGSGRRTEVVALLLLELLDDGHGSDLVFDGFYFGSVLVGQAVGGVLVDRTPCNWQSTAALVRRTWCW